MPVPPPVDPPHRSVTRPAAAPPSSAAGFTFIEILVVTLIVFVLSALAYPSYRDYVTRGALMDAVAAMSSFGVQMERHYQDHRTYKSFAQYKTPCDADAAARTFGKFRIVCASSYGIVTDTTYMILAEGTGPMKGFVFTLDQTGQRMTRRAPAGWSTCDDRWILKRGEKC